MLVFLTPSATANAKAIQSLTGTTDVARRHKENVMRGSLRTLAVALSVALLGGMAVRAAEKPQEKPEQPTGVRPGDRAPDFSLKNQDGKEVKLSDYKGKIVVLQWFNEDCPFIQRHYEAKTFSSLNDKYADKGVVQLAIDSTGASTLEDHQKWINSHGL